MERREAIKVMALGALGAMMPWARGDEAHAVERALNEDGGGTIAGNIQVGATPSETLDNVIAYFRRGREMGYDDVMCADDPVRLRIGWIFSKDMKFVENDYPDGMKVDDLPAMVRARLVHATAIGSPMVEDPKTGRHYRANYLWNDPDGKHPCPNKNLPWGEYMNEEDYVDDVLPGRFHSDHPMFNPQLPYAEFKAIAKLDSDMGRAFEAALHTDEGRIALVGHIKKAAGWTGADKSLPEGRRCGTRKATGC